MSVFCNLMEEDPILQDGHIRMLIYCRSRSCIARKLLVFFSMKIYMDACCLNRPFDDQSQDRVRLETEAILNILEYCQNDKWILAASEALDFELAQCLDQARLAGMLMLYAVAQNCLATTEQVKVRAGNSSDMGSLSLTASM